MVQADFPGAIDVLEGALPLCREGEFAVYFSQVASPLGLAYAVSGRVDEGIALLQQAVTHASAIAAR